ncbi:hypothetical protein B0H14DRAFT_3129220 [Mycena olivaceomarginata]|nr:hypothetical protein B0H14DRAFT_3129220 [Mycena olivaceomarginata]
MSDLGATSGLMQVEGFLLSRNFGMDYAQLQEYLYSWALPDAPTLDLEFGIWTLRLSRMGAKEPAYAFRIYLEAYMVQDGAKQGVFPIRKGQRDMTPSVGPIQTPWRQTITAPCGNSTGNGGPPKDLPYRDSPSSGFFRPFATHPPSTARHDLTPKGARPSKMHKSTAPPPFTVRFATVSADEAAQGLKCTSERKNTTLPSHSLASNIQVKELYLTPKQRREINALNTSDAILDAKFYVNGDQEQQSQYVAAALMALDGLDLDSHEANGNRWSVWWSTSKDGGKTNDCGYDHREAGSTKRRTAVNFTGCLAHAEITYVLETEKILRI